MGREKEKGRVVSGHQEGIPEKKRGKQLIQVELGIAESQLIILAQRKL